jgi:hypothetical protein
LDVLGFQKAIENSYSEGKEAKLLNEITEALNSATEQLKIWSQRTHDVKVRFFTDNVVIGLTCDQATWFDPQLWDICWLVSHYQLAMACKGFFIRGGISMGTLSFGETVVFGDALVKAHSLESTSARNPRVILHPTLKDIVSRSVRSVSETYRNTWQSFLMCDVDGCLFVNYFSALFDQPRHDPQHGQVFYPNEEKIITHRKQVEQLLQQTHATPEIWSKYFWVANYHNSFCERLGFKQFAVNESLLRPYPVNLSVTSERQALAK